MFKYLITIIIFLIVVFVIKVVFPLWRFYTLSENIENTYEMIDAVILKAMANEVENLESKKIVLKYGKYKVQYDNLHQAQQVLAKQCEKALYYGEKVSQLPIDKKEYEQERENITNIYNHLRNELWKSEDDEWGRFLS